MFYLNKFNKAKKINVKSYFEIDYENKIKIQASNIYL